MVIDAKMEKALNGQIRAELESAYLYLSMASWLDANDLPGCAHWMKKQAAEEQEHAMKIYGYVVSRGGRVVLEMCIRDRHNESGQNFRLKDPVEAARRKRRDDSLRQAAL